MLENILFIYFVPRKYHLLKFISTSSIKKSYFYSSFCSRSFCQGNYHFSQCFRRYTSERRVSWDFRLLVFFIYNSPRCSTTIVTNLAWLLSETNSQCDLTYYGIKSRFCRFDLCILKDSFIVNLAAICKNLNIEIKGLGELFNRAR